MTNTSGESKGAMERDENREKGREKRTARAAKVQNLQVTPARHCMQPSIIERLSPVTPLLPFHLQCVYTLYTLYTGKPSKNALNIVSESTETENYLKHF